MTFNKMMIYISSVYLPTIYLNISFANFVSLCELDRVSPNLHASATLSMVAQCSISRIHVTIAILNGDHRFLR